MAAGFAKGCPADTATCGYKSVNFVNVDRVLPRISCNRLRTVADDQVTALPSSDTSVRGYATCRKRQASRSQ
jgi:hypothetical protein